MFLTWVWLMSLPFAQGALSSPRQQELSSVGPSQETSTQPLSEQREKTWTSGGGPRERARKGSRKRAGEGEGQGEEGGGGRRKPRKELQRDGGRGGRRVAEAGVDPLHTRRELLLQRPHGPSGNVISLLSLAKLVRLSA